MKLLCFCEDKILVNKLKATALFDKIDIAEDGAEYNQIPKEYDVLLLSDRLISYVALPEVRQAFVNANIFFLMSGSPNYRLFQKVETMCHAHDVNIVYPRQTNEQIVAFISGVLKPMEEMKKNHVTTFVGVQSKAGVTSTVMAVATRLGMATEAKIGVLGLNSANPGVTFISHYGGSYLDELKTTLSNHMLSSTQLVKEMHGHNHFYYLAGNRDIKKRLHYSIKEIHYLIEQAKKAYDLVLIDAGCNFDDALCIQGLFNADTKFLLTNQSLSGLEAWQQIFEQVLEPLGFLKSDFLMLVNAYSPKPQLPDIKQISHDYGVPCLRHIASAGDLGMVVEANRSLLIDYDEPEYIRDIDFIVRALVKTYNLKTRPTVEVKKSGFMQRLFG
ncbi:MAG: hypothetical protein RO469_00545 [Thermincola sp.]|jgi:hypothetical protein|nr:hypothetical protein [Thermincola sp.]MDT3701469.1 hypothetical protein [Thermincola sp.]